jgi:hypothetical protein
MSVRKYPGILPITVRQQVHYHSDPTDVGRIVQLARMHSQDYGVLVNVEWDDGTYDWHRPNVLTFLKRK